MGFVRKVFGIVAVQMAVTMASAIGGSILRNSIGETVRHPVPIILSLVLLVVMAFTIMWGSDIRKKVPQNYIILGFFTLAEAFLFAGLTSRMDTQSVISAIVALFFITSTLFIVTWRC